MPMLWFALGCAAGAYLPMLIATLIDKLDQRSRRNRTVKRVTVDSILDDVLGPPVPRQRASGRHSFQD